MADKDKDDKKAGSGDGAACKNPPKADEKPAADDAPEAKGADAPAGETPDVPAKVEEPEAEPEPEPRVYTPEEIEEISRNVESYRDNTPAYVPKHVLSPEFGGMSNYENSIDEFRGQKRAELERLMADPDASGGDRAAAEDGLRTLDHLYENYHLGMNVFRTAKGGRSKLRE